MTARSVKYVRIWWSGTAHPTNAMSTNAASTAAVRSRLRDSVALSAQVLPTTKIPIAAEARKKRHTPKAPTQFGLTGIVGP
jgi:hypothetical protein